MASMAEDRARLERMRRAAPYDQSRRLIRATQGASVSNKHSVEVAKSMKRTEAAVRQKAKTIGIGLGHRR
jgi:hypothetical protein